MSDKDNQQPHSIPPEWYGQMPIQGIYGYPPVNPMMNPATQATSVHHPEAPDHHPEIPSHFPEMSVRPDMAQQHPDMAAQYQAMAAQYAQAQKAMQDQAAQYQAMAQQAAVQQAAVQQAMAAQAAAQQAMYQQAAAQGGVNSQGGNPFENDPMMQQAQAMLDGAMGQEEAGIFKELLGNLGMSDKEFWKGAMIGAAAALILSNESVRKGIMSMVSGTGDMFKSGGATVKDTASSVKENVAAGGEIFRDTYQAGKDGFKESVERHKATPGADDAAPESGTEEDA